MLKRVMWIGGLLLVAAVGWSQAGAVVTAGSSSAALADLTPTELVTDFYTWYLDYLDDEVLCHPLLDGAYQDSPYLTPARIAALDDLVAAACGFGLQADPFLCGLDVPQRVSTQLLSQTADTARVQLHGGFPTEAGLVQTTPLATLDLTQVDGHWAIDGVTCR